MQRFRKRWTSCASRSRMRRLIPCIPLSKRSEPTQHWERSWMSVGRSSETTRSLQSSNQQYHPKRLLNYAHEIRETILLERVEPYYLARLRSVIRKTQRCLGRMLVHVLPYKGRVSHRGTWSIQQEGKKGTRQEETNTRHNRLFR